MKSSLSLTEFHPLNGAYERIHRFDPQYVLISKRDAGVILGLPSTSFDRMRQNDPDFPTPIQMGSAPNAPLRFVLRDIYQYANRLIQKQDSHQDST